MTEKQFFKKYGQRTFDARDLINALKNVGVLNYFGVKEVAYDKKDRGVLLIINNQSLQAKMGILLDGLDLFNVYLIDEDNEPIQKKELIYLDRLVDAISNMLKQHAINQFINKN